MRNNLGGHWNHTFFWELMTPGGAKAPAGDLKSAIDGAFGDFDKMKAAVKQAGLGRFGSGWAWLAVGKDKKLTVFNTPYQDTPAHGRGAKAVLGIDVWEHAYYLKHQYQRGRLHRCVVERGELGQGGRQLQEGDGVAVIAELGQTLRRSSGFAVGAEGLTRSKKEALAPTPGLFPAAGWGIRGQAGKLV